MDLMSLYGKMPIWVQNMLVTAKGALNYFERYGREYRKYYKFCAQFDKLPYSKKQEYQNEQTVGLVRFAYSNTRLYKELYKGIDIESIKCVKDLEKLPILEKEYLRANIEKAYAKVKERTVEAHTGGTTGKSLTVRMTRSDMMRRMAMLDWFKARNGFINNRMRRATFNGKHIVPAGRPKKVFWRYNAVCKQLILSSFHITEQNIPLYIEKLNRFKPRAIDGFFSSIYDVAAYCIRHGIKLDFTPIAIFPTSETVTKEGRELIEKAFGARVFDQYASSEGAPFITECPNSRLHIELASGVFEWPFGTDEAVITSFTTHGTPLIRYRIGDSIVKETEEEANCGDAHRCKCNNESDFVISIGGREGDFLYTTMGARLNSGNVANVFKDIPNAVICAQLIQDEFTKITIRLVADPLRYRPEYDNILKTAVSEKFGQDMRVEIVHTDYIEKTAGGKRCFIINNVKTERDVC